MLPAAPRGWSILAAAAACVATAAAAEQPQDDCPATAMPSLLQVKQGTAGKLAPSAVGCEGTAGGAAAVLRCCVSQYADRLDAVRGGLGGGLRAHPLRATASSGRELVIGAGPGAAGARSVRRALEGLGMAVLRSPGGSGHKFRGWASAIPGVAGAGNHAGTRNCSDELRGFDYTTLPPHVDAVTGAPAFENFLNLFLAFPRARVILTSRDASSWAASRAGLGQGAPAPVQEPCGLSAGGFSGQEIASLYELSNDFIRCAVPAEQLIEFDVFAAGARPQPTAGDLLQFLGLPPKQVGYFYLQHQDSHPKRFTPIRTAAAVGSHAEGAGQAAKAGASGAVKVMMYAINEEHRADRRECITSQLAGSPYPASIVAAANLSSYRRLCPGLNWTGAAMDTPAASAILCSHFLVWQHAALHHADFDFIAVFEDDCILAPGVWDQVGALLAGPCDDFDYISVDTFLIEEGAPSPVRAGQEPLCPGAGLPLYPLAGWGTHMLIIRVSALPGIIEHASSAPRPPPVDHPLLSGAPRGIRARCWQPGLARQFGHVRTSDAERGASGCSGSVANSVHADQNVKSPGAAEGLPA